MKKLTLLLTFVISITSMSWVQAQKTIEGVVLDDLKTPLPGANILIKGSAKGIFANFDGEFKIDVKIGDVLEVSFLGMKTKEVLIKNYNYLNILLDADASQLNEIVLIGYGSSKKGDLTSAISTVSNIKDIASRPVSNFADFLQGNVAGVTVMQQGGDPTSNASIVIRGFGSVNSEAPLTVVDGVPYYGPAINPNDIASVSILKDASAAAIYGAQAASGVIVIQTKRGKIGKPQISLDVYSGFQSASNLPTSLNAKQQADVYNLAADNGGTPRQSAHNATQNPWGQTTRTNWMDAIFRAASVYNVAANIRGASDKVNYMTSFNYNKKEGILLGTQSERYSFRVKNDFKLTDKVTVGENIYFSNTQATGTNTSSGYSGAIISALYMPSAAPVYDNEEMFHGVVPYSLSKFAGAYGDVYNPVSLLLRPTVENPVSFINANVFLDYKIIDGLKFKTTYSFNRTNESYKGFFPKRPELGRTSLENSLTQSSSILNRWVWDNQLSYTKSFGNHNLNLTAIYSAQFSDYEYEVATGKGFSSEAPFNQYIKNASEITSYSSSAHEDALTSAIGRAMYNYNGKYFVSGSIRRDETSRLAQGNQSDVFPAASFGWKISKEDFFNIEAINSLKMRASWGQIGNINSVGYYSFDVPLGGQTLIIGEDGLENDKGVYAKKQSNPNLTWETSESIDIGLDATLFNNKLSLTLDYFEKTTKGMILPGLEDAHQGISAADVNGGEVKNTGLEIAASYTDAIGDFNFTINGNASTLKNELINLKGYNNSNINYVAHDDNVRSVLTPYRSVVGRELFSNHLIPYLGIFQSQSEIDAHAKNGNLIQPYAVPGDLKFQDTNGDGSINDDDKVFMDSYQPDLTYSFGLNLDYKGFDLGMVLQGVAGVKAFNGYKYVAYNASLQGYNLDNSVLNAWSDTNTASTIPRISTKDNNNNFGTTSSWYLEDASYLRLKNITMGYTMPKDVLNTDLRIFISAENIFTVTNYSGIDPEVGGKGLDVAKYPLSKTFTIGLSLKL
ncbi:SusC/RagA family TonB-linked outer membrane protein [Polaribacter sp. ALD11]|uniref:SusC/RagA family TonB-linked outer membrane protein n=1 Tax=Polaribacter sp. ALD11 TaxID=2058137 RepID=UPI000C30EF39|nr:TonB-dependent receptor [Polaribacter sp. ALD11]AUC85523.1 SusC/RagA family TonB-linked outer membrane protein [Polaribacter sp. ALD11]